MTNTTLIAKIAKASRTVGALATDKTNTQQNYNYISADKILERAGAALAEAGVVIIPAVVGDEIVRHEGTNQYGKAQIRYDAAVRFAMTISDGESQYEVPWCGRGSDYAVPDKALYKAITSGHKYFLMKLLNIGVGNEDGEHDSQSDSALQATQTAPERANGRATPNHAATAPKAPQRPAAPVTVNVDEVDEVEPDGVTVDNPFADAPPDIPQRGQPVTENTLKRLHALGKEAYGDAWATKRPELVTAASQGAVTSSKDLTENEARKLIRGMEAKIAQAQQPDAALRQQAA